MGEIGPAERRPFRPGQHNRGRYPVVDAAGVGHHGGHGVAAVGVPGDRDGRRIHQARQRAARAAAGTQQPPDDECDVTGLVSQVGLVRAGHVAAGTRECDRGYHVAGACPGVQQRAVAPPALEVAGSEDHQRELPPGQPACRSRAGRDDRISDQRGQYPRVGGPRAGPVGEGSGPGGHRVAADLADRQVHGRPRGRRSPGGRGGSRGRPARPVRRTGGRCPDHQKRAAGDHRGSRGGGE